MSCYLERLKAAKQANALTSATLKTLEREDVTPFEGFEGNETKHIPANDRENVSNRWTHSAVPSEWSDAFTAISLSHSPGDFEPAQWRDVLSGMDRFCAEWAGRAHALGWQESELFGLDLAKPAARVDRRGLALLLGSGSTVTAIDAKGAEIQTRSGSRQRFYRTPGQ